MFTRLFDLIIGRVDACPWAGHGHGLRGAGHGHGLRAGTVAGRAAGQLRVRPPYLYTPDQRRRRDATRWTLVQGVLAPVQFIAFLFSLGCVLHFLSSGHGLRLATISILIKTALLVTIMVTGAIWEKKVFGQYLFAPAFFWEDVFSFAVIALHTTYVVVLLADAANAHTQMLIALAAYFTYVINATQFIMKLRAARLEQIPTPRAAMEQMG